jgi:hypothetical protein
MAEQPAVPEMRLELVPVRVADVDRAFPDPDGNTWLLQESPPALRPGGPRPT